MPKFAAVVDVNESEFQNAQEFGTIWASVNRDARDFDGEVTDTFALLGRHDFLVLFETPDIDAAFRLSLMIERYGLDMETMVAVPADRLGEFVEEI